MLAYACMFNHMCLYVYSCGWTNNRWEYQNLVCQNDELKRSIDGQTTEVKALLGKLEQVESSGVILQQEVRQKDREINDLKTDWAKVWEENKSIKSEYDKFKKSFFEPGLKRFGSFGELQGVGDVVPVVKKTADPAVAAKAKKYLSRLQYMDELRKIDGEMMVQIAFGELFGGVEGPSSLVRGELTAKESRGMQSIKDDQERVAASLHRGEIDLQNMAKNITKIRVEEPIPLLRDRKRTHVEKKAEAAEEKKRVMRSLRHGIPLVYDEICEELTWVDDLFVPLIPAKKAKFEKKSPTSGSQSHTYIRRPVVGRVRITSSGLLQQDADRDGMRKGWKGRANGNTLVVPVGVGMEDWMKFRRLVVS
jgi:hypothetical protein